MISAGLPVICGQLWSAGLGGLHLCLVIDRLLGLRQRSELGWLLSAARDVSSFNGLTQASGRAIAGLQGAARETGPSVQVLFSVLDDVPLTGASHKAGPESV